MLISKSTAESWTEHIADEERQGGNQGRGGGFEGDEGGGERGDWKWKWKWEWARAGVDFGALRTENVQTGSKERI